MKKINYPVSNTRADIFCKLRTIAEKHGVELVNYTRTGPGILGGKRVENKIIFQNLPQRDRNVDTIEEVLNSLSMSYEDEINAQELIQLYRSLANETELNQRQYADYLNLMGQAWINPNPLAIQEFGI